MHFIQMKYKTSPHHIMFTNVQYSFMNTQKGGNRMSKAILALVVTIICGVGGIMLGLESSLPIPELGAVVAIAVMGAFIIYYNEK